MVLNWMKIHTVVTFVLFLGFDSSLSAPLEEAQFLRQIVNQYSPPLLISFLHSRLNLHQHLIKKIQRSLTLDKSKRDVFDMAQKTLEILDNQLIALEKADYFDFNGTDKVKYFIEQFIMVNEFYPIEFGSNGMVNVDLTVDDILEQLSILTFDKLINQTNTLIDNYLSDIQEKESSVDYNHLQKLSVSLMRVHIQSLRDSLNVIKNTNNNNGYNYNTNDPRKGEVDKVLRKLKTTIDFFYSQFNHLADQYPESNEPSEFKDPTSTTNT